MEKSLLRDELLDKVGRIHPDFKSDVDSVMTAATPLARREGERQLAKGVTRLLQLDSSEQFTAPEVLELIRAANFKVVSETRRSVQRER